MSSSNGSSDFETKVNRFYERCLREEEDHFQLMRISKTATHKEIENAYREKVEEFSQDKIENLDDPSIKKKANFIVKRLEHIYGVLINYDKRAQYEKMGYHEISPKDQKEEDPGETAKNNYKLGKSLYNQKAYSMALSALNEAVRFDPGKASYHLQLGLCQLKLSHMRREAETSFLKAVELEPWNSEHYASLGRLFYLEKLNQRAETYFRKALQLDPTNVLAKKGLAQVAPEKRSVLDYIQNGLKNIMPTIFDRKK